MSLPNLMCDFKKRDTQKVEKAADIFGKRTKGFYDWPLHAEKDLKDVSRLARDLRERFQQVLCIGIGGSQLGPSALQEALGTNFPCHWLSNVDPFEIEAAKTFVKRGNTAAIIISKSGETTETLTGFFHLAGLLNPTGYVAVTDPNKGELRRLANELAWETLDIPPEVGGRYSVLTSVGLLPAEIVGISAAELVKGAAEMRAHLEKSAPMENTAFKLAEFLYSNDVDSHSVQYLIPYEARLKSLADWYVQLWGESLGKSGKGATPVAALGTRDQHSILQLLKDGPRDKVVGFLEVDSAKEHKVGSPPFAVSPALKYLTETSFEKITKEASFATQKSLQNSNCPCYRIQLDTLDAKTIGAFFFFFETACAFAAELYEVDAFGQPGVEESKALLKKALH